MKQLKKIASIWLLVILLFNWFGYRLILAYCQEKAQHELEARLDANDYDESALISIKIPVTNLSYYIPSPEFERVDGSIEVGGIQYKYIKRRLFNDSLEMLCLPDHTAMKWQAAKRQASHPLVLKVQDDVPYLLVTSFALCEPVYRPASRCTYQTPFIPASFPAANEQPPDQVV